MRFQFFTIPVHTPEAAQEALNVFCAQHRIVSSDRQFVAQGADSFWAVCLAWAEGVAPGLQSQGKRDRVDYREVLSDTDFAAFAELRQLRKTLAEREGVPAYAIFTNEQLAEIVQRKLRTASALGEIEGVGKARVDKDGALFLALLGRVLGSAANGGAVPQAAPAPATHEPTP